MTKSTVFDEKNGFFEENMQFSGLIRTYARRLRDPHAEGELWGFLCIVKILTENKFSDNYYTVCLKNEYIRLLKNEIISKQIQSLGDWEKCVEFNVDKKIDLAKSVQGLTKTELRTVQLQYGLGYGVSECSALLNVSRQAFTNNRKRALKKMKKMLTM